MERTMFKVEHINPVLRERNGRFGYYGYDIATRLERKGHGKILVEGHVGGEHETKVLDAGGSGKYLTKAKFEGKRERVVLGRKNLYGDQEETEKKGEEKETEEQASASAYRKTKEAPTEIPEEQGPGTEESER